MPAPQRSLTAAERVSTVLACLAVDRRLGGVLFVGLRPGLLAQLARWLNAVLAGSDSPGTDRSVGEIITLGANHTDDDLWWQDGSSSQSGAFRFGSRPGLLIDPPDGLPRTVIVPDLARASIAVARAAVVVVGAGAAVADRHGMHAEWQPRSRWLAACAQSDLAAISPHLLDRFAVRVNAAGIDLPSDEPRAVRAALDTADLVMPLQLPTRVRQAPNDILPPMSTDAIELVVRMIRGVSAPVRRDLALARTARALAFLEGSPRVLDEHVLRAAGVLGLDVAERGRSAPQPAAQARESGPVEPEPPGKTSAPGAVGDDLKGTGRRELVTVTGFAPAVLDDLTVPAELLRSGIYPEDNPDSIPEYASLREPWQHNHRSRATRGPAVGTEPTRSLADIAFVATAFEAAKFQPMRTGGRHHGPDGHNQLAIWGCDLRRHRRQRRPDTAVVLVLDHTCRHDWDWSGALAPYLRWAYVRRAVLTVVEFGYVGAANELCADVYRASSVLDRRVRVSLGRLPGRATPLAHALDLAIGELRRQLRRDEVIGEHSWLVVASDCRGNVPLEASQRRRVTGLVSGEGVADAVAAAAALRSLPAIQRVVLAPPT